MAVVFPEKRLELSWFIQGCRKIRIRDLLALSLEDRRGRLVIVVLHVLTPHLADGRVQDEASGVDPRGAAPVELIDQIEQPEQIHPEGAGVVNRIGNEDR